MLNCLFVDRDGRLYLFNCVYCYLGLSKNLGIGTPTVFGSFFSVTWTSKVRMYGQKTGSKLIEKINKQSGDQKLSRFYALSVLFVKFTGQYGCHKCDIVSTGRLPTSNKQIP